MESLAEAHGRAHFGELRDARRPAPAPPAGEEVRTASPPPESERGRRSTTSCATPQDPANRRGHRRRASASRWSTTKQRQVLYDRRGRWTRVGGSGQVRSAPRNAAYASGQRVDNQVIGSVRMWVYGSDTLHAPTRPGVPHNSYQAMMFATVAAIVLASCIGFLFARNLGGAHQPHDQDGERHQRGRPVRAHRAAGRGRDRAPGRDVRRNGRLGREATASWNAA